MLERCSLVFFDPSFKEFKALARINVEFRVARCASNAFQEHVHGLRVRTKDSRIANRLRHHVPPFPGSPPIVLIEFGNSPFEYFAFSSVLINGGGLSGNLNTAFLANCEDYVVVITGCATKPNLRYVPNRRRRREEPQIYRDQITQFGTSQGVAYLRRFAHDCLPDLFPLLIAQLESRRDFDRRLHILLVPIVRLLHLRIDNGNLSIDSEKAEKSLDGDEEIGFTGIILSDQYVKLPTIGQLSALDAPEFRNSH